MGRSRRRTRTRFARSSKMRHSSCFTAILPSSARLARRRREPSRCSRRRRKEVLIGTRRGRRRHPWLRRFLQPRGTAFLHSTSPAMSPTGEWIALETRRGRRFERRNAIVGREAPRRTVIVAASGFWRWRVRGGAAADAFGALWGGLFDWLSAGRTDARAAVNADAIVHAGDPVRWRRGSGDDSVVALILTRRGAPARTDSMTLRFTRPAITSSRVSHCAGRVRRSDDRRQLGARREPVARALSSSRYSVGRRRARQLARGCTTIALAGLGVRGGDLRAVHRVVPARGWDCGRTGTDLESSVSPLVRLRHG